MKFSSSAIISLLASAAALSSSFANANMMECVAPGSFEKDKDYFSDKVSVEASEHWSISYENSYKILKNSDAGTSYVLYQCGTEPPEEKDVGVHDATIPIPLPNFGLDYTVFIPYMELLGLRSSISAMAGQATWVYSPCLKDMIDDNIVTMVSSLNNHTLLGEVGVENTLPYFVGVGTENVFESNFQISEWKETNQMAIFEWIKFFSAFFNLEDKANEIYGEAEAKVQCAAENAGMLSSDAEEPVVLWGYYSSCGGWDVARSCPNYYCELANTCGATLLHSKEGSIDVPSCYSNYMTTEEFVEFGKDADIWIYAGDDVDSILNQYNDELKDFVSVKNNKVYDVTGQTLDAWFAERKTEPDTLIQDFCSVVGRENPATPSPHRLTFLRHIDDSVASPAVCVDRDAPLQKLGSECVLMGQPSVMSPVTVETPKKEVETPKKEEETPKKEEETPKKEEILAAAAEPADIEASSAVAKTHAVAFAVAAAAVLL